jgi:cellulose biosynthesis protein BcsQ
MYDGKDPSAQVVYTRLKRNFKNRSFRTVIPFDAKMKESQIMKLPAMIYDKTCPSGTQYLQMARELLDGSQVPAQPGKEDKLNNNLDHAKTQRRKEYMAWG